MKTKILSIIMASLILMSVFTMNINIYADNSDYLLEEYAENNEFLKAIGVYDDDFNENAKAVLSRGEFIHYAFRLLNYNAQPVEQSPFWDLKPDYEYYKSVANAYMCGIVNGYADGSVGVYKSIKVEDAIGILVRILGYENFVNEAYTYPDGVHKLGVRLKLVDNLSFEEELTYSGMSALLKRVLRTPVMEQTVFGDKEDFDNSEDVTLLSQNFDIYFIEGIVTSDQISSLSKYDEVNLGKIKILDTTINMDYSGIRYLGYYVECWYKSENNSKTNELVYINPVNNDVTTILDEQFDLVVDNTIKYYINNKEKRVRTNFATVYIYNGKKIDYTTEFNEELFKINEGNIVAVDNNTDGIADVVYINNYYNFVVKNYSASDNALLGYGNKLIDFEDDELVYNIKDIYNKNIDVSSLKEYDVLSVLESKDKKYIDITVAYNRITASYEEMGNDGSYKTITLKGETYQAAPDYYAQNDISYYLGKPAVFCINMFGRVAAIYNENAFSLDKFALVVDAIKGEGARPEDDSKIQILDNSDNKLEFLKLNSRVKFDGTPLDADKVIEKLWDKAVAKDELIGTFIRYTQNEEGLVTLIDTPEKGTKEEELSLNTVWTPEDGQLTYKGYGYFAVNYYKNSNTKFFGVPSSKSVAEGDSECECYESLRSDYKTKPYIYTLGSNTAIMSGVVFEKEATSSENKVDEREKLFVVDNITSVLNSDGDEIKLLKLVSETGEVAIEVEEKQLPLINDLSRGDVVRYTMSLSGKLTATQKLFDFSDRKAVLGNNITNGHNQLRVGIASNLFDEMYLNTAMIDKTNSELIDKPVENGGLSKSDFVNISIAKSHVFKVDKENITFEPSSASNIKTYDVYGKDASIVISVMRYNQNVDMLIFSE